MNVTPSGTVKSSIAFLNVNDLLPSGGGAASSRAPSSSPPSFASSPFDASSEDASSEEASSSLDVSPSAPDDASAAPASDPSARLESSSSDVVRKQPLTSDT